MYKLCSFLVISCISSFLVYTVSTDYEFVEKKIEEKVINKVEEDNEQEITVKSIKQDVIENPLMIIEIPKINLKGNIYNKKSNLNNIDTNIIIINESNMPNEDGGTLIIGAHSGYGKFAYFKNLNNLDIGDEIIINYLGKKYVYKVIEYHLDSKDGSISINNINKKNKLFLFTCNPNDKNNYLVYNCER